jgi:hypothetical protein
MRNGADRTIGLVSLTLALVFAMLPVADAKMGDPATYFGKISELSAPQVDRLRSLLVAVGEECTRLERRCRSGDELFALIFGGLNVSSQPIHLVYIDDANRVRTNLVLHKHRVTPFMYGQRNVWVIVFAENPLELEAGLTTLWRQRRGTLSGLEGIFVSEGRETVEAREAQTDSISLVFDKVADEASGDELHYATGRFFVEPLAVYSTSITPVEHPEAGEAGFVDARANFSNSLDRSLDLGLALGATLRTEPGDDLVLEGVSVGDANLNLYLMLDIYIIKPALLSPMVESFWGRYRPSIGLAVGTNITFWEAQEFNVGVSLGHLFGRHGLVFGVNIIDPPDEGGGSTGETESEERLVRPYVAGLFKF